MHAAFDAGPEGFALRGATVAVRGGVEARAGLASVAAAGRAATVAVSGGDGGATGAGADATSALLVSGVGGGEPAAALETSAEGVAVADAAGSGRARTMPRPTTASTAAMPDTVAKRRRRDGAWLETETLMGSATGVRELAS